MPPLHLPVSGRFYRGLLVCLSRFFAQIAQRLPVGASGHAMEAVFEEFESLLAEATEQAEAAVKAASPPPPTPTTRVSEYDGG